MCALGEGGGGEAAGQTPLYILKLTMRPKYVSKIHYKEFMTLTTYV